MSYSPRFREPRIQIGSIRRHYFSGKIEIVSSEVRDDAAGAYLAIKDAAHGSTFDAFHAERWARPHEQIGHPDRIAYDQNLK